MSAHWIVIINPFAGLNRSKNSYKKLLQLLTEKGIEHTAIFTEFSNHLLDILDLKAQEGFRNFIISGGDGSYHECVNAVFRQSIDVSEFTFAFAPSGTGNDWARTFGLGTKLDKFVNYLDIGYSLEIDVGKISYIGPDNEMKAHYFANVAGTGYDTYIHLNYLTERKFFGPATYFINTLQALASYKNVELEIEIDGQKQSGKYFIAAFAICKYFGAGMKIAPHANPTDGKLAVTLIKDINKFEALQQLPRLKSGNFIDFHKVETLHAKQVKVSAPKQQYIEADGELLGEAPFIVEVIPQCLNVIVPDNTVF